ncbi:MAG: AAA family ATPase [Streptomyces sp.]|uniref:AAA family ATPase n=1 Tax=Streptomyces sp. TaxID=1931 RepID=UPI003D6B9CA5
MLLWINGPFGGGKTHTTFELHRRLPGSVVSDPEHLGSGLHRMLPREARPDYQDYRAWRRGVFEVLDDLLRRHSSGPVIVPMTLVEPRYFEEIVGRLRDEGHDVRHSALLASRETVMRRLHRRGLRGVRRETWAIGQVDRCLDGLRRPEFATHLHTDELSVPQVAESVARSAGLELTADTYGPLRRRLRRARVTLQHVRRD